MRPRIDEHVLNELGLTSANVGAPISLPAQGLVGPMAGSGHVPVSVPFATEMGFHIEESVTSPGHLSIHAMGDELELRQPAGARALAFDSHVLALTPGALQTPIAVMLGREGLLVLPGTTTDRPSFAPIDLDLLAPTASFGAESQLAGWLVGCNDLWLSELVSGTRERGGAWAELVAVALLHHLRRPDRRDARGLMRSLVAGGTVSVATPQLDWAQTLDPEQRQAAAELIVGTVEVLEHELEQLVDAVDPDEATWLAAVHSALCSRDDLEAVRRLLHRTDVGARVEAVLAPLDRWASTWIDALPDLPEFADDERIIRASEATPDGWWVLSDRETVS